MNLQQRRVGRSTRLWLLAYGTLAAIGLVYASLLPLVHRPMSWADALQRFRHIPWLDLGIYARADWVANGLVAMPFGFLLAGAADRDRRMTPRYLLWLTVIILIGHALIIAIEFVQIWFWPRTVSLNDIVAGCIGATIGPLLWPLVGRHALAIWDKLRLIPWTTFSSAKLAWWLLVAYCLLLAVYSVMPLDVMFSRSEWQAKWEGGRFGLVPYWDIVVAGGAGGVKHLVYSLLISTLRMIPLGFLVYMARPGRGGILILIGVPLLIELLQAPIFTRHTNVADVICGWTGALAGFLLAAHRKTLLSWNDLHWVRVAVALSAIVATLMIFLADSERWATSQEIERDLSGFFDPPFAKYYWSSEFQAGSNAAGKVIVFTVLGFLIANLLSVPTRRAERPSWIAVTAATCCILGTAIAIEVAQIYLHPAIGDNTDVMLYCIGGLLGWSAYRLLVTWNLDQAAVPESIHLSAYSVAGRI